MEKELNLPGDMYVPSLPGTTPLGFTPEKEERTIAERLAAKETPLDKQVGGNHYKKFKIQPVEFAMANNLNYCQGNAIKYICRYKDKNGLQDLEKAKHYIDLIIQMEYSNEKPTSK